MDRKGKFQGIRFGSLLLLIFLFYPFIIAFAQWEDSEINRLTENEFWNFLHSLTIGKYDKLFLLFAENTTHVIGGPYKILMITKENGQDWTEPVEVGDTSCHLGQGCDYVVSIDPQTEVMHLLYYGTDKIYYSNSERDNWEKDLVDSGYKHCTRMAFDSSGNVHLAWAKLYTFAGLNYFKIYYATNASGEWVKQAISPDICTYWSEGGCPEIEVEREGVAHIIYPSPVYMNHAWNNALAGTTWITRIIPPPEVSEWYGVVNFKIDKDNQLHALVYASTSSRGYVFYYHKFDSDTIFTQGEEIYNLGDPSWLFIDKDGHVHACGWRPGGIYYSNNISGTWKDVYQIVDHTKYYSDLPVTFAIDSEGKGHITFAGKYYDPIYSPWDSTEIFYLGPAVTAVPETIIQDQIDFFQLSQNYPNPSNTSTLIPFRVNGKQSTVNSSIPTTQQSVDSLQLMVHSPLRITLVIYNILGEKVRTLVDEEKLPGEYQVLWDGKNDFGREVSSGVYFYRLKAGDFSETRKMVLIK